MHRLRQFERHIRSILGFKVLNVPFVLLKIFRAKSLRVAQILHLFRFYVLIENVESFIFVSHSVSLPTSSRCKLESCLDLFIKEEILDGDEMPTCSKCKTRRKSTKSFTIHRFPKYLVIRKYLPLAI